MYNINTESLKIYRDYTYERSSVYYKKVVLKLERPWTTDPYLDKYKFTCHRRELDRETKFLIDTVINSNISYDNKLLNCALFRIINSGEATKHLMQWPVDFDNLNIEDYVKYEQSTDLRGIKYQSNAYFLSHARAAANRLYPNLSKYQSSLVNLINHFKQVILDAGKSSTAEEAVDSLGKVLSFGSFMTYQVWVDWTYIPEYPFSEDVYVVSGPGCNNGIDWMLAGESLIYLDDAGNKALRYGFLRTAFPDKTYEDFIYWFKDNLPRLMSEAGLEWNPTEFQHYLPTHQQNWGLMQIENSFCEFNKLMKLRNNINMRVRYY